MASVFDGNLRRSWQFPLKSLTLLVVCAVLLLGAIIVLSEVAPIAHGYGQTYVTLHFVVLDAATSSPIPAAVVRFYKTDFPWAPITDQAETSALGKAEITRQFTLLSTSGSFLRRQRLIVPFDEWDVEVSAQGYKPSRRWLPNYTGRPYDLELLPPEPTVVVKLDRLDTR